jgi:small GTP-binding protein
MAHHQVVYALNDAPRTHLLLFSRYQKVGGFLEIVKQKHKQPDLSAIYLDGCLLDNEDQFDDWFGGDLIFRVTNSRTKPPLEIIVDPLTPPEPEFGFKIVLIGDSGVGKTNLLGRFTQDQFCPGASTTIGLELATKVLEVEGKTVKVQIRDTAGQERYRAITSTYYRGVIGALLLYDVSARQTFQSLARWLQVLREHAGSNIVVMLVGNKCDLREQRAVSTNDATAFANREKLLFIETSALGATNVTEAFTRLITEIVHRLSKGDLSNDAGAGVLITPPPTTVTKTGLCC